MRVTRIVVGVLLVVVGVGVGLGIARLTSRAGDGQPTAAVAAAPPSAGDPDALTDLPPLGEPLAPAAATDPERAVAGYLTAEARSDFAGSYEFLSTADRETFTTPAEWTEAHADLAPITAFEIEDVAASGDRATVVTLTGFEAGLDESLGLTPARARSTWTAVDEGGLWRVLLGESTAEPLYLPDRPAADVARDWAEGRRACTSTAELEHALVGVPALGDRLCDARGELRLGPVSSLGDTDDTAALVSAYGPEVTEWARTVTLDSPEPMQIVLAPIGTDWKVIGVIRPGLAG